ncbi:MAG: dolichyl-phosphate beta-glucosyltransferase [Chloroflexota bacterium]
MKDERKAISLLIPAYNEELWIVETIHSLIAFLEQRFDSYEILVIDDGSTDGTTELVAGLQQEQPPHGEILLLKNSRNMGKGYSIRLGVMQSRGEIIVFLDADMPYALSTIDDFIVALNRGCSVVIGSRLLPDSVIYDMPLIRSLVGKSFSFLVQYLLLPGFPDTQCGFKGFTAQAAHDIFRRMSIRDFGFDIELLYIAKKLDYPILAVPVTLLRYRRGSRVHIMRDSFKMLFDIFLIRWNDWRGAYLRRPDLTPP